MIDKKLNELIELIQAWIDRHEADACVGCAFWDRDEWEMPCTKCRRNCKDYWRRADDE